MGNAVTLTYKGIETYGHAPQAGHAHKNPFPPLLVEGPSEDARVYRFIG